jgi:hypothetical protein
MNLSLLKITPYRKQQQFKQKYRGRLLSSPTQILLTGWLLEFRI